MTSPRVSVKPAIYRWAYERNRLSIEDATERFEHLPEWIEGTAEPTLKQLEVFANAMHAPIGFFFGDEPPDEPLPIEDFRTVAGKKIARPSPDLLDVIYACQLRQGWYQEFAEEEGLEPLPFVGSVTTGSDVVTVAAQMRRRLGFEIASRARMPNFEDALRRFIEQADDAGILVMTSGIVGSATNRVLDPEEFRGFSLADPVAPLVFVNGADSKSAQMFTLAHELAHIWLGATGVSKPELAKQPAGTIERWCDAVAAEFLVPLKGLAEEYDQDAPIASEAERLAKRYKVSRLVMLRRMHDAGGIGRARMWEAYDQEVERLANRPKSKGGNFYLSTAARVGKRFARAMLVSTWGGRSTYTEAFRLLSLRNAEQLQKLGTSVGMP